MLEFTTGCTENPHFFVANIFLNKPTSARLFNKSSRAVSIIFSPRRRRCPVGFSTKHQ